MLYGEQDSLSISRLIALFLKYLTVEHGYTQSEWLSLFASPIIES